MTLSTFSQMSHAITVSNGGSGATKNIHFTVEKDLADKVVFIEATAGSASDKTYLRVTETKLSSNKVGSLYILHMYREQVKLFDIMVISKEMLLSNQEF